MRALDREIVVPGHGATGTIKILDDMEKYDTLLLDRVGALVGQGESLDEIKRICACPRPTTGRAKTAFPITSKQPAGR